MVGSRQRLLSMQPYSFAVTHWREGSYSPHRPDRLNKPSQQLMAVSNYEGTGCSCPLLSTVLQLPCCRSHWLVKNTFFRFVEMLLPAAPRRQAKGKRARAQFSSFELLVVLTRKVFLNKPTLLSIATQDGCKSASPSQASLRHMNSSRFPVPSPSGAPSVARGLAPAVAASQKCCPCVVLGQECHGDMRRCLRFHWNQQWGFPALLTGLPVRFGWRRPQHGRKAQRVVGAGSSICLV